MQAEGASSTVVTTPIGGEHLDNIGEFEFLTPPLLVVICNVP
jgi:hypothetical protein